jgi:hypothetical protein
MKQPTKKLDLNKKTIVSLNEDSLEKIKGGDLNYPQVKTRDCIILSIRTC